MHSKLGYALYCAYLGIPVIPLHENSKTPLLRRPFDKATLDPEAIDRIWCTYPDANIGLAMGAKSDLFAIDLGKDGKAGFMNLIRELDIPDLLSQGTVIAAPHGGLHIVLRSPTSLAINGMTNILPGVNLRSTNGYIVAAGSIINGKAYHFVQGTEPLDAQPELLTYLLNQQGNFKAGGFDEN